MSRLLFLFLFFCNVQATTLYIVNGEIIKGHYENRSDILNPEKASFKFNYLNKAAKTVAIRVLKTSLDSVVLKDTTLRFDKGVFLGYISDTSTCIFNVNKIAWKKGLYRNYAEFYYNCPSLSGNWILKNAEARLSAEKRKKVNVTNFFELIDSISQEKLKFIDDYWGYCDGENIYYQNESFFSMVLIDEQFLFADVLHKVFVDRGVSTKTMPMIHVPTTTTISTPGGSFAVNIGGSFIGGGGSVKVKIMKYEPIMIERTTGITSNVFSYSPYNIEKIIREQPDLLKEYKLIPQTVVDANPLIKTKFFMKYLDLTDNPWFTWYDDRVKAFKKDLEQYNR